MISKKIFSVVVAGLLICGVSSNAFAEFLSVSIGIPVMHTLADDGDGGPSETESVSGALIHVKLPIMLGLGYESYVTKLKDASGLSNVEISTSMFDFFWLTPIPIINFTIGAGLGTVKLDCDTASPGFSCSDIFEEPSFGSAYQLYAQLGVPILPLFDIHLSYHQISASLKEKSGGDSSSLDSTMIGLGAAFTF